MLDKKTFVTILVIIIIVLGVSSIYWFTKPEINEENTNLRLINSTVAPLGNSDELKNEIKLDNLLDNDYIQNPLEITGQAKGTWFQEGEFSARIVTEGGLVLDKAAVIAEENWMTENFVEFTVTFEFEPETAEFGSIYFTKSNPSGLEENKAELRISIKFNEE